MYDFPHPRSSQGNEGNHSELRARVLAHVDECREEYEPFVEDDEPFHKYVARMRKVGARANVHQKYLGWPGCFALCWCGGW